MLIAAVGLLTLGLTQGPRWGWDERVLGAFAPAAVLGAVFLRRCARHPAPVVELALLRVPAFALAGLSTLLFSAGFAGLLLGNVLWFTEVWDYSVLKAGFAFAPGPLLAATTAIISGRLADGRQPAAFGAVGGFVFAAGCLWFITHAGAEPAYLAAILPGQVLTGIGVGLMLPSFTATAAATLAPSSSRPGSASRRCAARSAPRSGSPHGWRSSGRPRPPTRSTRSPPAGCSWRSPRCSPGSPCCRWPVGGSSIDWSCDLGRDPRARS